jgi:hypothetical protein
MPRASSSGGRRRLASKTSLAAIGLVAIATAAGWLFPFVLSGPLEDLPWLPVAPLPAPAIPESDAIAELLASPFDGASLGAPWGEPVYRVGAHVTKPILVADGRPLDSQAMRKAAAGPGSKASPVIEAIIDAEGRVRSVRWLNDSVFNPILEKSLLERRYQPAMIDGKPVSVYMVTTVTIHWQ